MKELLGHADLQMTTRAYTHLLNRTVAQVVRKKLPSFGLEDLTEQESGNPRRLRVVR